MGRQPARADPVVRVLALDVRSARDRDEDLDEGDEIWEEDEDIEFPSPEPEPPAEFPEDFERSPRDPN